MNIRKNSGFTLWEMMVIMAVIAIISALALPSYIQWMPKYRASAASRDVLSALEFARFNAIRTNSNVNVNDAGNNAISVTSSEGTLLRVNLPDDVTLTVSGLVSPVTFNSQGFSNQAGSLTVTSNRNASWSWTITLTLGGNAAIQ